MTDCPILPSPCWSRRLVALVLTALAAGACAQVPASPTAPSEVLTVGRAAPQAGTPVPTPDSLGNITQLGATRFLAFGDSITCGTPGAFPTMAFAFDDPNCTLQAGSPQYPQMARSLLQAASPTQTFVVDNQGRPGEEAALAFSRFSSLMAAQRPQGVLLLEGINDLNTGRSVGATVDALARLLDLAALYNSTVLVGTMFQTCLSVNPFTLRVRENSTDKIVPFNTALRAMVAGRQNVYIVDLYASFGGGNCLSDRGTNYVGEDGLHPSPSGYSRIASTFAAAIRDRFAVRGSFQ
jgi:lysophospholipase L1-like esterase